MDICEIKFWASRFRRGIEMAHEGECRKITKS